jgi:hypothetical protein
MQAVRKNGSGYYLVLHPHHPAAGRPDFLPWVLGKQQMSLVDTPSPFKEFQSRSTKPAMPGPLAPAARRSVDATSLRQMSRDLGQVKISGTPVVSRPPQHAVLSALQHLGLPTPAVTGGKPGAGARQGAALERAGSDEDVSYMAASCLCVVLLLLFQAEHEAWD